MKQSDIDRLVEIIRVETASVQSEIRGLKKQLDALALEREEIEKAMLAKAGKGNPIVVWESSGGVLVEA